MSGNMFHGPNRDPASDAKPVEFSEKDREDAARLLSLIIGEGLARDGRSRPSLSAVASAILYDRNRRTQLFSGGMFGEPAWDVLLTLYAFETGSSLTISELARSIGCSLSTLSRWLDYLEDQNLIRRRQNLNDARSSFVGLTDKAGEALSVYLSDLRTSRL